MLTRASLLDVSFISVASVSTFASERSLTNIVSLTILQCSYFSVCFFFFFFSSRRRHTRSLCDWSSDVCSSDLSRRDGAEGADRRDDLPRRLDCSVAGRAQSRPSTTGWTDQHIGCVPGNVGLRRPDLGTSSEQPRRRRQRNPEQPPHSGEDRRRPGRRIAAAAR